VWLGARTVSSREIVVALHRRGLRRPKHSRSSWPVSFLSFLGIL